MLPYIKQNNPALCTGCGACAQVCPQGCLTMQRDVEGFAYPIVETTRCLECGLCAEICPVGKDWRDLHETAPRPRLYAAWHLDDAIRQQSSSGGVFTALSNTVLQAGGVVFGAGFSPDLHLRHITVTNLDQLDQLRGSKYVQSSTENTYKEVRAILNEGKQVLYSGTPCQIAGLYAYLGSEHERLFTVDIICHGVPSPQVFERYLQYLETRQRCKVRKAFLRAKPGWRAYSTAYEFKDGYRYEQKSAKNAYQIGFLQNLYLRPCCSFCAFAQTQRIGDITLGDFWGIAKCHPELDDDRGISEVLINTQQGQRLFDISRKYLSTLECHLEDGIQENMLRPSIASPQRAAFFADLGRLDFEAIRKKYLRPRRVPLARRIVNRINRMLRASLRPKR